MLKFGLDKEFKFAITDNTVYTGKNAYDFYSNALLSFKSREGMTVVPNVKSKIKLADFNLGNIIQGFDCTFAGAGEGTLAQRSFEVCDFKINLEYCVSTFEQNFLNEIMRPGVNADEIMPGTFEDYVFKLVSLKMSGDVESLAWKGDTGTTSYPYSLCDGLEKKLGASGSVVTVTATSSLTAATVVGELTRGYNAIPIAVYGGQFNDLVILASTNITRLYKVAQATVANGAGSYFIGDKELNFLGIPIIEAPGMSSNKYVIASRKNLLLLTDLESEIIGEARPRLIPQLDKSGAATVRVVGFFKLGVDFFYGSEIVYYA